MAAVITLQSSSTAGLQQSSPTDRHLLRPLPQNNQQQPPQQHLPQQPLQSPSPPAPIGTTLPRPAPAQLRDGPSCDACLRRKSRCAINMATNKCYSCDFHRQECTFTLSATTTATATTTTTTTTTTTASRPSTADISSKKRKIDELVSSDAESPKRLSTVPKSEPVRSPLSEHQRLNTVAYWHQSTQHIGLTTELEPALLAYLPVDQNDESFVAASRVRKLGDDGTFMRVVNTMSHADSPQSASLDAIESLVAPYGSTLVEKYFERIHPTFPILMEDVFRQSYRTRNGISPLLLSAVYVLALKFVDIGPASQSARRPDAARLESTALKLLTESLPYASISTIQAGLLLMQKSTVATAPLNAQLVTAGFELGLHQDCSDWRMETWEKGLRKRLAWALYMQDKWSALVHGRPSHVVSSNWTVQDLVEEDFSDTFTTTSSHPDDAPIGHGPLFFCHMVALTTILSDILDRFYTLQSIEEFKAAGNNRTRLILERAKPAQIRLKDWFARLPGPLKLESATDIFETITEENARNGALHLSYFATEITLHRCIVRSLSPDTADAYLSHICRSAAKTRLISAMDFVNRLRPPHLRSFWPAASRTHFALIGSFGILLRVTAPTKEEAEFYRLRLCEYRWTLSVSKKDAEFLEFALDSLDNATNLDHHVPEKPGIDELMTSASKPTTNLRTQHEESMLDMEGGHGGTSSVISGLASPATSISEDSMRDAIAPI
ncbi:fungal-specific transcription factor domain-containing protein [Aspergillus pseudodeflectus]|uniref:Fungal-specific transcription factor domain-containing protein n=1 Tax=Aspergillus pseudodeflectus TaxID=176178 RepID=A0ABR4L915_9EURO